MSGGPIDPSSVDPTPAESRDSPLKAAGFEPRSTASRPQPTLPRKGIVVAAVTLILLICLGFLLTARSLEVVVRAEGSATIDIDGLALALGGRYLLRPGHYPVEVTVPGYRIWSGDVTVTDSDSQRLEVTPAPLPGTLKVTSSPTEAEVTVDGQVVGKTPTGSLVLDAGSRQLRISAPRYQPHEQVITVQGRGLEQAVAVELIPNWAEVTLSTVPDNATLSIDGAPMERPEPTIEILAGEHELTLSAPGYRAHRRSISITPGVPVDLGTVTLEPADGVLTLTSTPSGANTTVDGRFVGQTPIEIELSPGREHRIQLSMAGYSRSSLRLTLDRGSHREEEVSLEPELGSVAFNLSPDDAELVLNGQPIGLGSRRMTLPAFEHRVEVRREGYATQRTTLVPRPGLEQAVDIELLTEAEARTAALTPEITSALGQTLVLIDPLAAVTNEFSMGAPRREPGRRANEVERPVRLERAFYIATTETTNAQFRQFLASHDSGQIEGNSLNREHQPVVQVSWQQAARFCNWLSDREGLPRFYRDSEGIINGYNASSTGYRLPTEAEWAFAARIDGTTIRRFAWGDTFPPTQPVVNVADNTSALVTGRILNGYADGHVVSAPVASFPANHQGLYDMGGNVAEWVHDVYSIPSPNAAIETDPLGPLSGDNYTVRGGSWALSRLSELRLTFRDYGAAGRDDLGFRIARYAE